MEAQFKLMDLKRITVDLSIQSRAGTDENTVDEYAQLMADNIKFPPPIVYFDGTTYLLAAGFHRYAATKATGAASIKVEVRTGDINAAKKCSVGENHTHGLNRSNNDKRAGVRVALSIPEYADLSDREIARIAGVSNMLVSEVRRPEQAAAKKAAKKGDPATPRDQKPTSKPGVTISNPPSEKTTPAVENESSFSPEDETGEDPVKILSAEVDELKGRIAIMAIEGATDEERTMYADGMAELQRGYAAIKAERDSISAQHNALIRENGELKREVVKLRKRLDQALAKA